MGKEKNKKGTTNRHLNARISFLQRSSLYLTQLKNIEDGSPSAATREDKKDTFEIEKGRSNPVQPVKAAGSAGAGRFLANQLRQVARKSQIRLPSVIKQSICKTCNTVLIDGVTSESRTENTSRKKVSHADVRVIECRYCNTTKRFPFGATRQPRKTLRVSAQKMVTTGLQSNDEATAQLTTENS